LSVLAPASMESRYDGVMRGARMAWILFFFALMGCKNTAKPAHIPSALPTVVTSPQEQSLEREMFERVNQERQKHGLAALQYDERLAAIARFHSQDMRETGFFGHQSPSTGSPQDRIDKAGYVAAESRENVALAPDVDTAHRNLLASPGHYANIVATTVTHLGVGVVQDKKIPGQVQGYFFTQLFAKPVTLLTPEQARAQILRQVSDARRQSRLAPLPLHPALERFAKDNVQTIDARAPGRSLESINQRALALLQQERGLTFRTIEASAQAALGAEFLNTRDLLDPTVRAVGFALATGVDAQGKSVLTMLILLGR